MQRTRAQTRWKRNVLIAIGLVLGLVTVLFLRLALGAFGCRFPISKSAESQARTIRAAVQNWQSEQNASHTYRCPTVGQLIAEKHLDSGAATLDPWGNPYRLNCTDAEVFINSAGPDGTSGTPDDILVPRLVASTAQ